MQKLSIDIETKILSDMDERIHEITQMMVEKPDLIRVVDNVDRNVSSNTAYAYRILYTYAHAFHLRQRVNM
jgi:hypothetical protein